MPPCVPVHRLERGVGQNRGRDQRRWSKTGSGCGQGSAQAEARALVWGMARGPPQGVPRVESPHRQTTKGRTATGLHVTASPGEDGSNRQHASSITMERPVKIKWTSQGLEWLLMEAGIALGCSPFIVWWTMKNIKARSRVIPRLRSLAGTKVFQACFPILLE